MTERRLFSTVSGSGKTYTFGLKLGFGSESLVDSNVHCELESDKSCCTDTLLIDRRTDTSAGGDA